MSARDMYEKDYYAALGVAKDADAAAIKKVYRKLAREFHPDTSKGDKKDEARFKEVSEAYEVLSDPASRAEYDEARALYAGGGFRRQTAYAGGNVNDMFNGAGDLNDMLSGLFGQRSRGPRRGSDQQTEATISFRDAINGTMLPLRVSLDGKTSTINARVPAGVNDGARIRLKGKGGKGERGATAGDLFVNIHVTPHPVFGRKGENLTMTVPVTFPEATLGADIEVPTLDEGNVTLRLAPGTASGRTLRVKGKGVAKTHGARGDLLVTIEVAVPQRLEAKERDALEMYAKETSHHDARKEFLAKAKQR
ncbi:MAG TPA: DnaJ C-terminal domain-containing protein [Candidatus Nanopelagicaceae bacterium]|nr:DnaJ C-terminal domain-containing protein [Candidatus Nanopelagicaceae bacterium]